MAEIVRFKSSRVWRAPLLAPAKKRAYARQTLAVTVEEGEVEVVFEKQGGVWIAAEVPRRLTYLQGLRAHDFRVELQKEGFEWRWIFSSNRRVKVAGEHNPERIPNRCAPVDHPPGVSACHPGPIPVQRMKHVAGQP